MKAQALGTLLALPVLWLGASGCPKDPSECKGDFCLTTAARIEVEPSTRLVAILHNAIPVGESLDVPVRVINTGDAVLQVLSANLAYLAPSGAEDGSAPALALVPPVFTMPTDVYPKGGDEFPQGAEIVIRYTRPADDAPREATLTIGSNDPRDKTVKIVIRTEAGAPSLSTDKAIVDFRLVPKGTTVSETVKLFNVGTRTLQVSGFEIDDVRFGVKGQGFEIGGKPQSALAVDLAEAIAIGPGEFKEITVSFVSDSPTPADGELRIFSDDPDDAAEGHLVRLVANRSGPCVLVSPRKVEFGGKLVGGLHTLDVDVTSCGSEPLRLTGVALSADTSPDFGLDFSGMPTVATEGPSAAAPLLVPVNETVTFSVTFVPDEVNPRDADNIPIPDEGSVLIRSNAFESEVAVPLSGAGAEAECPVAVIKVTEGEEVLPQTVLHLDATQSYASFGGIASYEWKVQQPSGSQETLVPSVTDPRPIFAANVVGLYTFTLRVRDEAGTWSCEPATYSVIAQPDQALHIELTWSTPGDLDETDTGEGVGSDLDLHFTHPNATGPDLDKDGAPDPWFDSEYDCFWHNTAPNWASFDPNADDDPSLDRDDTDGAGPENLNLGVPEEDTTYRIAVHYWDAHGLGPVSATVRVFSYAAEVYAREAVALDERDLWCVAHVHWLSGTVDVKPCATPDELIVPDYVNPFFFQP